MKKSIMILVSLLVAGVLVGCGAHSSQGVTVVGDNLAKVPSGATLGLSQGYGKRQNDWELTFDGTKNIVHINCFGILCGDEDVSVGEVNKVAIASPGLILRHFEIWKDPDGTARIKWPTSLRFKDA